MTTFLLAALALLAVTAIFLLPPLLRGRAPLRTGAAQRDTNLAILRDQLAELEREQQEGSLSGSDFEQARDELKRRILEETALAEQASQNADTAPSKGAALAVVLALVLGASAGYALLGNPMALDPAQRQAPQAGQAMSPEQIQAMVDKLAARMAENPDDEQGWVMLARSYKVLGRLEEAAQAYAKAEKLVATDPGLLTDYAETLAMASGKGLKGKPLQLVQQALKLDPEHGHALFLAGAAAMESGNRLAAADYWEKLLPQVEPGSELHTLLKDNIDKIRAEKKPGKTAKP